MRIYAYSIYFSFRCVNKHHFDNLSEKKLHDDLAALVNKIPELNKRLTPIRNTSFSERDELLREIQQTDKEIDNLVYDFYELTEEERQLIEASLAKLLLNTPRQALPKEVVKQPR